ncbi:MAG TPA: lytic transglycosylase domain-containing protein [Ancylobacter sp.]
MHRIVLFLVVGLSFAEASSCTATAQTVPVVPDALEASYSAYIAKAAQRFDLPAAWIRAVLQAESGGDPRAVSQAGAMGLMQIMPATWDELRLRHGLGRDPFAPCDNIYAGAAYLRELFERYGSVTAMLAAYNAGPARYEASLAGQPLPTETRAYVAALTPIIDNEPAAAVTRTVGQTAHSWREAPLFAAQLERSNLTKAVSITPQPGDLFIAPLPSRGAP